MARNVVALVPARAGSKGLPGKNTHVLDGKPLYRHSVDAAIAAGIKNVVISTDIEEIFAHELPDGVTSIRRPNELAGDDVPMAVVVNHFINYCRISDSVIVLLQPTSPLRKPDHIKSGIQLFRDVQCALVMSVCPASSSVLKWGQVIDGTFLPISDPAYCFTNRQSLPKLYRPNGALYIFDADRFRKDGDFPSKSVRAVKMTETQSVDVDSLEDLLLCERLMKKEVKK